LEHMGVKNHYLAFFANKTWAGGAMPRFNEFAEKIKWEIVAPHAEVSGEPLKSDIELCKAIASAMAEKLQ
ncbi:FprA family A-type flavoprotein, partial [Odoribacter sp. OttesenSCG-928-J03]|nr:FprA family A-type flavoprotein [Odoribacter sp. OttesenSCG-928-J03]